jgi:acetoin utilization deacetylase AcuC-like enzyme
MDDPVFPGMYEASALVAGATITAAEMVMNDPEVDIAFNVEEDSIMHIKKWLTVLHF